MRASTWTIFLLVSLKGIASVSAALATPATEPDSAIVRPAAAVESLSAGGQRSETPGLQGNTERKPGPIEAKPLSKDFSSPKPVQIYWFFGGR